jgi:hypothetical protein
MSFLSSLFLWSVMLATPPYQPQKLPYHASWGAYTVRVDKAGKCLHIQDKQGRTLRSVCDTLISKVDFVSLRLGTPPALHVVTSNGMAHGGLTDFLFLREPGVKNVLVFLGMSFGIHQFRDFNGDGRKEILAYSDALVDGSVSCANSPGVLMVLGWKGGAYVDRTRHYASLVRREALAYRKQWEQIQHSGKGSFDQSMGCLAGYYGNMTAIGQEKTARGWVLKHVPLRQREIFLGHERKWREASASLDWKVFTSQKMQLKPTDWITQE